MAETVKSNNNRAVRKWPKRLGAAASWGVSRPVSLFKLNSPPLGRSSSNPQSIGQSSTPRLTLRGTCTTMFESKQLVNTSSQFAVFNSWRLCVSVPGDRGMRL